MSNAVNVAKQIRKALKLHGIKGSVRKDGYNSVKVNLQDELPAAIEAVKDFCAKFQCGHFNGMDDIYEYSNARVDVPQVEYVFVVNKFSDELKQAAWDWVRENFGGFESAPSDYKNSSSFWHDGGLDGCRFVHQVLVGSIKGFWLDRKPRVKAA